MMDLHCIEQASWREYPDLSSRLGEVVSGELHLVADLDDLALVEQFCEALHWLYRHAEPGDSVVHGHDDPGRNAVSYKLASLRPDGEDIPDRHEKEIHRRNPVDLRLVQLMTQVPKVTERSAVHLELEDGDLASLRSPIIIVIGGDAFDANPVFDRHHGFRYDAGIGRLDQMGTVVIEMVVGYENQVCFHLWRRDPQRFPVVRVCDDYDAPLDLKTRVPVPSYPQLVPSKEESNPPRHT